MDKIKIASLLKKIGLYKPVRSIYNFLFLFNAKRIVALAGINVKFKTPTFTIVEDVGSLLGESKVLSIFLNSLREDDVVWDIGASYGIYSLFASSKLSSGKIYAFEPEIKTYKLLEKNIRLNNLQNIVPLNYALSDCEGFVDLYVSDSANIGTHSLVMRDDFPVSKKGKLVNVRTGDKIVQGREVCLPNVVKIDVEGAEMNVLEGMKDILFTPKLRLIQIEIHEKVLPLFNRTVGDVFNIMETSGYKLTSECPRGTEIEVIFERKN